MKQQAHQLMQDLKKGLVANEHLEQKVYDIISQHHDYRNIWSKMNITLADQGFICEHRYTDAINLVKEVFHPFIITQEKYHAFAGDDLTFRLVLKNS
jgi:hypothetical protein